MRETTITNNKMLVVRIRLSMRDYFILFLVKKAHHYRHR